MKRLMATGVAVLVAIGLSLTAYATCHDDYDCEDVTDYVSGIYKWASGNTLIRYYINSTSNKGDDDPDITADVKTAAKKWSNITFDGETIPIRTKFVENTTTYLPTTSGDGKNTIGWH